MAALEIVADMSHVFLAELLGQAWTLWAALSNSTILFWFFAHL